jgi:hypothetical protein
VCLRPQVCRVSRRDKSLTPPLPPPVNRTTILRLSDPYPSYHNDDCCSTHSTIPMSREGIREWNFFRKLKNVCLNLYYVILCWTLSHSCGISDIVYKAVRKLDLTRSALFWDITRRKPKIKVGPHDRSSKFVLKVCLYLQNSTVSHPRRHFEMFTHFSSYFTFYICVWVICVYNILISCITYWESVGYSVRELTRALRVYSYITCPWLWNICWIGNICFCFLHLKIGKHCGGFVGIAKSSTLKLYFC